MRRWQGNVLLVFGAIHGAMAYMMGAWWVLTNELPPFIGGRPGNTVVYATFVVALVSCFFGAMIRDMAVD